MNNKNQIQTACPTGYKNDLWDIAVGYLKISMLSFGGSLTSWAHTVIVEERNWLTDTEFLNALAFCRILPGPNQVNLAVYVGTLLRGGYGALAALTGLIIIPFITVLAAGIIYFKLQHIWIVESVIRGMAIVAVGMTAGMGLKMSLRYSFASWSILVGSSVFFSIGILRWPLLPVLAASIPISIGLAWFYNRNNTNKDGEQNDQ